MGGKDPDGIGQAHHLALDGVVELAAQFLGGEADRGQQVGATDIADEQRVAGQDAVGHLVVGVLIHQHADRLGGVTGRLHDLQNDVAEGDPLPFGQRADLELGLSSLAVADPGAGGLRQLQMAGQEVGVKVGVNHANDPQPVRRGVIQVLLDVAAGIDDHCLPGRGVTNQVGGLGQAVKIVVGEMHGGLQVTRADGSFPALYPPGYSAASRHQSGLLWRGAGGPGQGQEPLRVLPDRKPQFEGH